MGCTHSHSNTLPLTPEIPPPSNTSPTTVKLHCIAADCKSKFVYKDTQYCYGHAVKNIPAIKESHTTKIKVTRVKNKVSAVI